MPNVTFTEANRRFRRWFGPVMGCYCAVCVLGPLALVALDGPPRWVWGALAVAASAPIVVVFWLMGRLFRETDEFSRMVHTDAALRGGAMTLCVSLVWGFLELFQLAPRVAHFPSILMVGPLFFASYGVALAMQRMGRA